MKTTAPKEKCRERVWPKGPGAFARVPCGLQAARDGYCRVHHPDAVAARKAARGARDEARWARAEAAAEAGRRERRLREAEAAAASALVALVDAMLEGVVSWPALSRSQTVTATFAGASKVRAAISAAGAVSHARAEAAKASAVASTFEPGYSPDDEAREARERRP